MIDHTKDTKGCLFVGEGVTISGEITLPGAIFVDGVVDGTIEARELFVGASGCVTGSAKVAKADIRGVMGYHLEAAEHVTLRSTGRLEGKVVYRSIDIERGGIVQGEMVSEAALPEAAAAVPAAEALGDERSRDAVASSLSDSTDPSAAP